MDWTPETNRIQTMHLTADELAAMKAAKYGWLAVRDNGTGLDIGPPAWHSTVVYRAKPAPAPTLSITVNGVTNVVAAPVTKALHDQTLYWVASPTCTKWVMSFHWTSHDGDRRHLERGLIHLTEAAARAHAMAMVGLKAEGV